MPRAKTRSHRQRNRRASLIRAMAKSDYIRCEVAAVEWEAAGEDGEPKVGRFRMTAYTGGPMQIGYYGSPVAIDLAGLKAKAPIPILLDHDHARIVGHADAVEIATSTLKLSGLLSGAGESADQVAASAAKGFPWKASVGARPDKLEFVGEGVTTKVNGKTLTGPIYVARKATLQEVSFVAIAADDRTSTQVAASAAPNSCTEIQTMTFQQWIEAMGLSLDELRDDQVAKLQAKYDAELKAAAQRTPAQIEGGTPPADPPAVVPPTFDLRACVLAYEKHVTKMDAICAEYAGKVPADKLAEIRAAGQRAALEAKAQALDEEWPEPKLDVALVKAAADVELALVRAERPAPPAIHASTRDQQPAAIEAAFCRTAGMPYDQWQKEYPAEVLEASDRFRGIGIQEVLMMCARANGYSGREFIRRDNFRDVIQAAFSTHTITTLLTSTGNKILLSGFNSIPQTWRNVAAVRNVSDFKAMTAYRLTTSLEYAELPPTGEIEHGSMGQESYTYQARTYAKMLTLTRMDIINDDLGAFNDLRNRLGIGAAIKMNKVFWTLWLTTRNGAAFWTAARGNLVTAAPLGETGLNSAVKAFRDMAAPDGNMMSLEPDRILIPSDLEATGRKLYVSQEVRDTTASTKTLVANIYQNRFRPVVVPELGNSSYTGYSTTSWHLLADPGILASAAMCFLDGVQEPTIESSEADFSTLGIALRGYHDFGPAMTEYRASVEVQAT